VIDLIANLGRKAAQTRCCLRVEDFFELIFEDGVGFWFSFRHIGDMMIVIGVGGGQNLIHLAILSLKKS